MGVRDRVTISVKVMKAKGKDMILSSQQTLKEVDEDSIRSAVRLILTTVSPEILPQGMIRVVAQGIRPSKARTNAQEITCMRDQIGGDGIINFLSTGLYNELQDNPQKPLSERIGSVVKTGVDVYEQVSAVTSLFQVTGGGGSVSAAQAVAGVVRGAMSGEGGNNAEVANALSDVASVAQNPNDMAALATNLVGELAKDTEFAPFMKLLGPMMKMMGNS